MSILAEAEARIKQDAEFHDRLQCLAAKVVEGKASPEELRDEAATIMRDIYKVEYESAWRPIFEHQFGPLDQFDFEAVSP